MYTYYYVHHKWIPQLLSHHLACIHRGNFPVLQFMFYIAVQQLATVLSHTYARTNLRRNSQKMYRFQTLNPHGFIPLKGEANKDFALSRDNYLAHTIKAHQ